MIEVGETHVLLTREEYEELLSGVKTKVVEVEKVVEKHYYHSSNPPYYTLPGPNTWGTGGTLMITGDSSPYFYDNTA